jgi:hypothetical protein
MANKVANIKHKITTTENIDIKKALVNKDLMLEVENESELVTITDYLKQFVGKVISISITQKTEEDIEDELEDLDEE